MVKNKELLSMSFVSLSDFIGLLKISKDYNIDIKQSKIVSGKKTILCFDNYIREILTLEYIYGCSKVVYKKVKVTIDDKENDRHRDFYDNSKNVIESIGIKGSKELNEIYNKIISEISKF